MPLDRLECTGASMFPDLPHQRQAEIDLLLDAARAECDSFTAERTDGTNRWIVVPTIRDGSAVNKNLITIWATPNQVCLDIRPKQQGQQANREPFDANEVNNYQQRMAELFSRMQQLP